MRERWGVSILTGNWLVVQCQWQWLQLTGNHSTLCWHHDLLQHTLQCTPTHLAVNVLGQERWLPGRIMLHNSAADTSTLFTLQTLREGALLLQKFTSATSHLWPGSLGWQDMVEYPFTCI